MADPALRRRLWLRAALWAGAASLALLCMADHLGAFGYHGDDHAGFDGRTCTVTAADSDGTLDLRDPDGRQTQACLLGVRDVRTTDLVGKSVTVKLDGIATRDGRGRLRAYLFSSDEDDVNLELIEEG